MIQFQENARRDRRAERWKDGQTLFYRTLLATPGGLIKRLDYLPLLTTLTIVVLKQNNNKKNTMT